MDLHLFRENFRIKLKKLQNSHRKQNNVTTEPVFSNCNFVVTIARRQQTAAAGLHFRRGDGWCCRCVEHVTGQISNVSTAMPQSMKSGCLQSKPMVFVYFAQKIQEHFMRMDNGSQTIQLC
jgi:hypothetical protein